MLSLEFYRLQHVSTAAIELGDDDSATVKSPTEVGTGRTEEDEAPLSEIIANLNDRFGTAFQQIRSTVLGTATSKTARATRTSARPPQPTHSRSSTSPSANYCRS